MVGTSNQSVPEMAIDLVLTNIANWKITICNLFLWAMATMAVLNNQRAMHINFVFVFSARPCV